MARSTRKTYIIRPLEMSDIPTMSQWFTDLDELSLFDRSMRIPLSLEASEKSWSDSIGNSASKGKYWFAIVCNEDKLTGIVGLEDVSLVNGDAIIPMYIEKTARNRGLGIRSLAMVLDLAFRQLGLNRLTSYYRVDNGISRSLIERLGFREEGCMRQAWFAGGRYLDMIVIGILRQEWLERRQALAEELDCNTVVTFGRHSSGRWSWPPADVGSEA